MSDNKFIEFQIMTLGAMITTYSKIAQDLAQELLKSHPDGYDFSKLRTSVVDEIKSGVSNLDYGQEADILSVQIKLADEFFAYVEAVWKEANK